MTTWRNFLRRVEEVGSGCIGLCFFLRDCFHNMDFMCLAFRSMYLSPWAHICGCMLVYERRWIFDMRVLVSVHALCLKVASFNLDARAAKRTLTPAPCSCVCPKPVAPTRRQRSFAHGTDPGGYETNARATSKPRGTDSVLTI